MIGIALYFFIYILDNLFYCFEVLVYIQSILNNTLISITNKMFNKIANRFLFKKPLDQFSVFFLSNIYVA